MKPKTIHKRAAAVLKRIYDLPKEVHDDDSDYTRTVWFHAGYRAGWLAAQRASRKSK